MTRYELLDRIGVGGMAEIFRGKAVAAGGFEKPVAIKRILPHLSQDKRFVELLIAEAKVLSLLKHRNIVQIFDVGLGDDGQYFLVMEYVDGKDLGAIQRVLETTRRRIPVDLVLHIGAEICEALEHAHSARAPDGKPMSLVHRDVSPSNVLVSRAGEIKLTDFGIAKRAEQEHTSSGAVRGKFAYISPEQARNEHLDPRSDVFSVGIVLWELATGQRLFSGLGALEALRAVREAKVRAPSEVAAGVPPELDRLVMAALAREPGGRPTTGELGASLRSLRYSLEVTVGDPATELAKIMDDAARLEGQPPAARPLPPGAPAGFDPEPTEHTVIRIRTADAFSTRRKDGKDITAARQVIDRFEEAETRLAQLSDEQLRALRAFEPRDAGAPAAAPPRPGRDRRDTDEPTTTRAPLRDDDLAALGPGDEPTSAYDPDATRLVAPSSLRPATPARQPSASRTPGPARQPPSPTRPPSTPGRPPSTPGRPSSPRELVPPGQPAPSRARTPVPDTAHAVPPYPGPPGRDAAPSASPEAPWRPMRPSTPPPWSPPQQPASLPAPVPSPMHGAPTPSPMHGAPPASATAPVPTPMHGAPPAGARGYPASTTRLAVSAPRPWMLVLGAIAMAVLAFVITRALIGG